MNPFLLTRFVKEAAMSANPQLASQAGQLDQQLQHSGQPSDRLMDHGEDESIVDADVMKEENPNLHVKGQKDDIDQLLHSSMPEIVEPEKDEAGVERFGEVNHTKQASAYIKDIALNCIPGLDRKVIARFADGRKEATVIIYGMVVKELLKKTDSHNFDVALAHVKKDWEGKSLAKLKDEVYEQAKTKYVLLVNDQVIDGNHFLAKAKLAGMTSSLNVIDLTPLRFQEKTAEAEPQSVWDTMVQKYGNHDSRENSSKKRSPSAVSRLC